MTRSLLVALLLAHGWVHLVVWGMVPAIPTQAASPSHSWLLGDRRPLARGLTALTMALFAAAAVGLALQGVWWGPMAVAAAQVSVVLVTLFRPRSPTRGSSRRWRSARAAVIAGVVWFDMPVQMVGG